MKTIEIVVHCFSERHPVFARLLTMQLSSMCLWPPKTCDLLVTVVCKATDEATQAAANTMSRSFKQPANVRLRLLYLEECDLFRRAIGRNIAALGSCADILWYADCDYAITEGFLDRLAAAEWPESRVAYPQAVQVHRSHAIGDAEIARITPGRLFTPDMTLFEEKREKFAIGGLQFCRGEDARKYGYLNGTSWVDPVDPAGGFRDTKCDKAYRSIMGGSLPMDLPGLYRFRHSDSAFEPAEKRLAQTAGKT